MRSKLLIVLTVMALAFSSCETEDPAAPGTFSYKMGDDGEDRTAAEVYFNDDSTFTFQAVFNNGDLMTLYFINADPAKTTYAFGETLGIDSDIMIGEFRNNEIAPLYWGMDSYKSGTFTVSSWQDDRISGSFDFSCNTLHPVDLTSNVFNFKGTFSNVPVQ